MENKTSSLKTLYFGKRGLGERSLYSCSFACQYSGFVCPPPPPPALVNTDSYIQTFWQSLYMSAIVWVDSNKRMTHSEGKGAQKLHMEFSFSTFENFNCIERNAIFFGTFFFCANENQKTRYIHKFFIKLPVN